MIPAGELYGRVVDKESKDPVSGVKVFCLKDGQSTSGESKASGAFHVKELDSGNYSVTFKKDGYKPYTTTVTISRGEWKVLLDDVELEPDSEAIKAYRKYLEDAPEHYEFSVVYVDKDNIPELMVRNKKKDTFAVYSYVNKKMLFRTYGYDSLSEFEGGEYWYDWEVADKIQYYKKKGIVVVTYNKPHPEVYYEPDSPDWSHTIYNMPFSKGSMQVDYLGAYYEKNGHSDYELASVEEGLNGYTKKQYDKELKRLVGSTKLSTPDFHKNTKENRNKYL